MGLSVHPRFSAGAATSSVKGCARSRLAYLRKPAHSVLASRWPGRLAENHLPFSRAFGRSIIAGMTVRSSGRFFRQLVRLRRCPRGHLRITRGRCGSLLLHRDGLAPSTPCRSPGALRVTPQSGHCSTHSSCLKGANSSLRGPFGVNGYPKGAGCLSVQNR
jgi:hypothetical protein